MRDVGLGLLRPIVHTVAVCLAASASSGQLDRGDAPAPAAPAVPPQNEPDLAQLVADMGSGEVQTRIDAQGRLTDARSITLARIEQFMRASRLSAEQRVRLLAVAHQRFMTEPRAGMGVQSQFSGERGAVLLAVVPGFPASQVLKAQDRIIAAAGTAIDTWDTLRAVIISRDPDDEIPVTVVREGATLSLRVRLGRFDRLDNARIEGPIRETAWGLRSRDLQDPALKGAKPIENGLSSTAWLNAGVLQPNGEDAIQLADAGPAARTGVVAGGESRGGVPRLPDGSSGGMRVFPRDGGRPIGAGLDAAQAGVLRELQLVQARRLQNVAVLEMTSKAMADPSLDERSRRALRARATQLETEIRSQDQELQRLMRLMSP